MGAGGLFGGSACRDFDGKRGQGRGRRRFQLGSSAVSAAPSDGRGGDRFGRQCERMASRSVSRLVRGSGGGAGCDAPKILRSRSCFRERPANHRSSFSRIGTRYEGASLRRGTTTAPCRGNLPKGGPGASGGGLLLDGGGLRAGRSPGRIVLRQEWVLVLRDEVSIRSGLPRRGSEGGKSGERAQSRPVLTGFARGASVGLFGPRFEDEAFRFQSDPPGGGGRGGDEGFTRFSPQACATPWRRTRPGCRRSRRRDGRVLAIPYAGCASSH